MRWGCLSLIGIVAFLAVIAIIRAVIRDSPDMIWLSGEAHLSSAAARAAFGPQCDDSARMFVIPRTEDDIMDVATIEITSARRLGNGTCAFAFSGDVPDAEEYTFELDGVDDQTVRRSTMDTVGPSGDTELAVRLSW